MFLYLLNDNMIPRKTTLQLFFSDGRDICKTELAKQGQGVEVRWEGCKHQNFSRLTMSNKNDDRSCVLVNNKAPYTWKTGPCLGMALSAICVVHYQPC